MINGDQKRSAGSDTAPEEALLSVRDLRKSYAVRRFPGSSVLGSRRSVHCALDGVSIDLARGAALGVVGESGSGKTTLVRSLVRLVKPDSGEIRFDGTDVIGANRTELARLRQRVQLVYQNPYASLNPALRIGSAIAEPALVHNLVAEQAIGERVSKLMSQVGLPDELSERRPRELSGGQRQRVAIARALATEPELLIADEAVSALDVSIQAQILDLFRDLREQLEVSLIFVAHQLATVAQLCERVIVLYRGKVVESGPTGKVFADPQHPYTQTLMAADPGGHAAPAQSGPGLPGALAGDSEHFVLEDSHAASQG